LNICYGTRHNLRIVAICYKGPAKRGQLTISDKWSHDLVPADPLFSIPTRYAGAIRTWRSTPVLQHSIGVAWTVFREVCCPGGTVCRATRHIHRPWSKNVLPTESYRSLRDGFFGWHTPGNKLPGYDHSVPPGQRLSTPVHKFDARSPSLRAAGFEDENEAPAHDWSIMLAAATA